jgi:hypothetical protein
VVAGTLALLTVVAAACTSSPSGQSAGLLPTPSTTTTSPPTTATVPPTSTPSTVAAPAALMTSPPASIEANCSKDVSGPLHKWFKSLAAGATVMMQPGACYLVNEGIKLKNREGLTVHGGEFKIDAVPQDQRGKNASNKGHAVFWLIGGSHVTFEGMKIVGANGGGYHPHLAFEAGIRSDGVEGLTVSDVTVDNVYGDGIELNVLRGARDDSGRIIRPTSNVTITHVTIDGVGRMGISPGGVTNATITDVHFARIGINDFDLEADQGNEGASNVTINGCTANGSGALFFANGGAGAGAYTHDITVENCTMLAQQGGDVILVQNVKHSAQPRGPFTFAHDTFKCGVSAYVACVQITHANVTVRDSTFSMPHATAKATLYKATHHSVLTWTGNTVNGPYKPGKGATS